MFSVHSDCFSFCCHIKAETESRGRFCFKNTNWIGSKAKTLEEERDFAHLLCLACLIFLFQCKFAAPLDKGLWPFYPLLLLGDALMTNYFTWIIEICKFSIYKIKVLQFQRKQASIFHCVTSVSKWSNPLPVWHSRNQVSVQGSTFTLEGYGMQSA